MEFDSGIEHLRMAYWAMLVTAGPVLAAALAAGLVIGVLQAATSINETTLSFVPKLVVVLATLALASGFMLATMTDFFLSVIDTVRAVR
jgi:flagellar biosynthetic protein FliQ